MNLKSFLKKETNNSVGLLVKATADNLKSASFDVAAAMFIAAVSVCQGLGLDEELRLLGLLVVSRFGEKGQVLPQQVGEIIFGLPQEVPAPAAPPTKVATNEPALEGTPTSAPPALKATPQSTTTAPARTLEVVSSDKMLDTWRGQLKAVAGGNTDKTLLIGVTNLTTRIFSEPIDITAQDWPLLFSAAKAANKNGTSIINNKIATQTFFGKAPTALVREYVFADSGVLTNAMSNLSDLRGKMELWLQTKISVMLNAVCSLGRRAGLSESEIKRLEQFSALANGKAAPQWLIEKIGIAISIGKPAASAAPAKKQVEKVNGLQNLGQLLGQLDNTLKTTTTATANAPEQKKTKKAFRMSTGVPKLPAEKFAKPESVATAETTNTEQASSATADTAEVAQPPEQASSVSSTDTGGKKEDDATTKWIAEQLALEEAQSSVQQPVNGKCIEPPPPAEKPMAQAATIQ